MHTRQLICFCQSWLIDRSSSGEFGASFANPAQHPSNPSHLELDSANPSQSLLLLLFFIVNKDEVP
jgi:hypothetical protein